MRWLVLIGLVAALLFIGNLLAGCVNLSALRNGGGMIGDGGERPHGSYERIYPDGRRETVFVPRLD